MPEYDPVAKISIIPRGQAGGLTFFAPSEERLESGLYSRSYLENQMAVALGGRFATQSLPFIALLDIENITKLMAHLDLCKPSNSIIVQVDYVLEHRSSSISMFPLFVD